MTEQQVDSWLKKISLNGYFTLAREYDEIDNLDNKAQILADVLAVDYIENELGLVIRLLSENNKTNVIKLSVKGRKVLSNGGWIEYLKKEKSRKSKEKRKKDFAYWIGIIIPFLMLLSAVWTSTNDNQELRHDILKEVREVQTQQIKTLKNDIQILSKRLDSVLLKTEQQNENN